MKRLAIITLALMLLNSCAHVLSESVVSDAKPTMAIPFEDVRTNIDTYVGKTFVWGGFIVKTRIKEDGSYVEIVQNPVDSYGYIEDTDISGGRFLAFTTKHLDPLIYQKDRLITVGGKLIKGLKKTVGGTEYTYPVLEIADIYLWKEIDYLYSNYYNPYPHYYGRYYQYSSQYAPGFFDYYPYDPFIWNDIWPWGWWYPYYPRTWW